MTAKASLCSWNKELVSPEVGTIDPNCWSVCQEEFECCDLGSEDTATVVDTSGHCCEWFRNGNSAHMFQPRICRIGICAQFSYPYRLKEQGNPLLDNLMICFVYIGQV